MHTLTSHTCRWRSLTSHACLMEITDLTYARCPAMHRLSWCPAEQPQVWPWDGGVWRGCACALDICMCIECSTYAIACPSFSHAEIWQLPTELSMGSPPGWEFWPSLCKFKKFYERNRKSAEALWWVCRCTRRTPPPQNLGAKADAWDYNQQVHVGTLHTYNSCYCLKQKRCWNNEIPSRSLRSRLQRTGDVSLFWNVLKA